MLKIHDSDFTFNESPQKPSPNFISVVVKDRRKSEFRNTFNKHLLLNSQFQPRSINTNFLNSRQTSYSLNFNENESYRDLLKLKRNTQDYYISKYKEMSFRNSRNKFALTKLSITPKTALNLTVYPINNENSGSTKNSESANKNKFSSHKSPFVKKIIATKLNNRLTPNLRTYAKNDNRNLSNKAKITKTTLSILLNNTINNSRRNSHETTQNFEDNSRNIQSEYYNFIGTVTSKNTTMNKGIDTRNSLQLQLKTSQIFAHNRLKLLRLKKRASICKNSDILLDPEIQKLKEIRNKINKKSNIHKKRRISNWDKEISYESFDFNKNY